MTGWDSRAPTRETGHLDPVGHVVQQLGTRAGDLQACLLLLLVDKPGHGYDLFLRLGSQGFDWDQPASVYRALKALDAAGLAKSRWEAVGNEPPRRVFDISATGRRAVARLSDGF